MILQTVYHQDKAFTCLEKAAGPSINIYELSDQDQERISAAVQEYCKEVTELCSESQPIYIKIAATSYLHNGHVSDAPVNPQAKEAYSRLQEVNWKVLSYGRNQGQYKPALNAQDIEKIDKSFKELAILRATEKK